MERELRNVAAWTGTTLAIVAFIGILSYQSQKSTPGTDIRLRAEERALRAVEDWPQAPRMLARALIQRHGPPHRRTRSIVMWYDREPFKRIAVHGTGEGQPLELVVSYVVPPSRRTDIRLFGRGISIDPLAQELAVRGDNEAFALLALNLAEDIASRRRDFADAAAAYGAAQRLWYAGKSSPATERLLFAPLPPEATVPEGIGP